MSLPRVPSSPIQPPCSHTRIHHLFVGHILSRLPRDAPPYAPSTNTHDSSEFMTTSLSARRPGRRMHRNCLVWHKDDGGFEIGGSQCACVLLGMGLVGTEPAEYLARRTAEPTCISPKSSSLNLGPLKLTRAGLQHFMTFVLLVLFRFAVLKL